MRRFYAPLLFILSLLFTPFSNGASLVSMGAGRVGESVLTTREVMMVSLLEIALYNPNPAKALAAFHLRADQVLDREFVREATSALIEAAISFEAESFMVQSSLNDRALQKQIKRVTQILGANKTWLALEPEHEEVVACVQRKIRAKEFIKFKIDSGAIPVTDKEVEDYFNNNRLKFENLPFDTFKQNIKNYLTKQQVDRRIKDWFELLQAKYRVRNYLLE